MNTKPRKPPSIPGMKVIDRLDEYIYKTAIFRSALQLEIWDKIARGADTPEKIASATGWDLPGIRALLNDLYIFKLLKKKDDRFALTREAEYYLIPGKFTYEGNFLLKEFLWEGEGMLAETIRTGKRPIQYNAVQQETIDLWLGVYVPNLTDVAGALEKYDDFWKTMGIKSISGMHILDVACGPAPRTLALARQDSNVQVTLVDWEKILDSANRFAAALGVEKQVACITGDLWSVDFGSGGYDLAFLGFVTHFFGMDENIRLFRKLFAVLKPGGILAINSIRKEYPMPLGPQLWFYAVSKGGGAYDFEEYRQMLEQAGFIHIKDVAKQPIRAEKPRN